MGEMLIDMDLSACKEALQDQGPLNLDHRSGFLLSCSSLLKHLERNEPLLVLHHPLSSLKMALCGLQVGSCQLGL
jgi:hypothetical protein